MLGTNWVWYWKPVNPSMHKSTKALIHANRFGWTPMTELLKVWLISKKGGQLQRQLLKVFSRFGRIYFTNYALEYWAASTMNHQRKCLIIQGYCQQNTSLFLSPHLSCSFPHFSLFSVQYNKTAQLQFALM